MTSVVLLYAQVCLGKPQFGPFHSGGTCHSCMSPSWLKRSTPAQQSISVFPCRRLWSVERSRHCGFGDGQVHCELLSRPVFPLCEQVADVGRIRLVQHGNKRPPLVGAIPLAASFLTSNNQPAPIKVPSSVLRLCTRGFAYQPSGLLNSG